MGGMRYLSLFDGIGAVHVAAQPLGWTCVATAEIEPFPAAVVEHRFPGIPNLGDVTKITDAQIAALGLLDLVVGGSPCQDLSVAGKQCGLSGERSGLFHEQVRIFHAARHLCGARYLLWENVPGAFSTNGGRDFAIVVGALAGCVLNVPAGGWRNAGVALGTHGLVEWCVLDAQFFGVAQRRRRVFALLDTGNWAGRGPVLLEPESVQRHPAPSRESRQEFAAATAPSLTASGRGVARPGESRGQDPVIAVPQPPSVAHTLRGEGFDASGDGTGRGTPLIAFTQNQRDEVREVPVVGALAAEPGMKQQTYIAFHASQDPDVSGDVAAPLAAQTAGNTNAIAFSSKDYGADAGDISPTLRSMGHHGSHANGGGQVAVAVEPFTLAIRGRGDSHNLEYRQDGLSNTLLTPNGGRGGIGVGAVAFKPGQSEAAGGVFVTEEYAPTLQAQNNGSTAVPAVALAPALTASNNPSRSPQSSEVTQQVAAVHAAAMQVRRLTPRDHQIIGGQYGDAPKAGPVETLRTLRAEIGEEAFSAWAAGVLVSFQPEEVLRQALHGAGVRLPAWSRNWLVYCTLALPKDRASGAVQSVRESAGEGCASQGWQPQEQLSRELGAYLSELPRSGASAEGIVFCLRQAGEGSRLLQSALSAVEKLGRPVVDESKSAFGGMQVRRLTPTECEFLQGFPRNYTLIPYRGKPAADGPRYKALGNSMAVPVVRWIFERLARADESCADERAGEWAA